MLKIAFIIICAIHGLIHIMGFLKAFELKDIPELTLPVSRPAGVAWLIAALMFIATATARAFDLSLWPALALASCALSQALIFTSWKDAKFGTIANVIIAALAVYSLGIF